MQSTKRLGDRWSPYRKPLLGVKLSVLLPFQSKEMEEDDISCMIREIIDSVLESGEGTSSPIYHKLSSNQA